MRQVFITAATLQEAEKQCPWAAIIVEVEGGWLAFEDTRDYETWRAQL